MACVVLISSRREVAKNRSTSLTTGGGRFGTLRDSLLSLHSLTRRLLSTADTLSSYMPMPLVHVECGR